MVQSGSGSGWQLRQPALILAGVLGLLSEQLLRADARPGVNLLLCGVAGALVLWGLSSRRGWPVSLEARCLIAGALLFLVAVAWRDAEALFALNVLAAVLLVTLAAARGGEAWVRQSRVTDVIAGGIGVGISLIAGPLGWLLGERDAAPVRPADEAHPWRRRTGAFARGAVLATPLLLVFGALLGEADPVFAQMVDDALRLNIQPVLEHLAVAAVLAWFTAGYLRAFLLRDRLVPASVTVAGRRVGSLDIMSALWLMNALFALFVVVQLRYLFGGAGMVEVTPGLSYAEYARRGFFELVAVAALVVPVLLVADWAAAPERARDERMLRATSLVQLILVAVIIASALYRMWLYQEAYGLTEDRLLATAFMVWVALVLAWLAATVLRGRRQHFMVGAVAAAVLCLFLLNVMNPHAVIARVNAERAAEGHAYDAAYAAQLSADAVPALLAVLPRLPSEQRCTIIAGLRERWIPQRAGGWRTWNYGDWRARQLVRTSVSPSCPEARTADLVLAS